MKKIYASDENIRFKTTKLSPLRTKSDIDAVLAFHGITKVAWIFDPDMNNIQVSFELSERFKEQNLDAVIKLTPPLIWSKGKSGSSDVINWRVSMRILHWYIKENLEMAYAMQSTRIQAFLPYIQIDKTNTVKDVLLSNLSMLKALPNHEETKVIDL